MAKVIDPEELGAADGTAPPTTWLTGEVMSRMEIEQRPHLIQDVIGGPGVHLLLADPKVGKSRLSLEVCFSVATGSPLLGRFAAQQGSVLYWQADDINRSRFVSNYQALITTVNGGLPLPNFEACIQRLSLIEDGGLRSLEDRIQQNGARLAVIDCLQAVRGIRTRDFVGQEFDEIRLVSETVARHNCTAVLTHHMASGRRASGPNPFVGAAGTFALNGGADGLAALSLFSTTRTERLVHVSGRDVDGTKFVYARDTEGRLFFVAGGDLADVWDDAIRLYRTLRGEDLTGKTVGEAIGCSDRQGRGKLARLRAAGAVEDISARRFIWSASFRQSADRVIRANAWQEE